MDEAEKAMRLNFISPWEMERFREWVSRSTGSLTPFQQKMEARILGCRDAVRKAEAAMKMGKINQWEKDFFLGLAERLMVEYRPGNYGAATVWSEKQWATMRKIQWQME